MTANYLLLCAAVKYTPCGMLSNIMRQFLAPFFRGGRFKDCLTPFVDTEMMSIRDWFSDIKADLQQRTTSTCFSVDKDMMKLVRS